MVIDEVDYDSTLPEGQGHIFTRFSQVTKSQHEVVSVHTPEKLRPDLSIKKEDATIIINKVGKIRKCIGAKAKKHVASLVVGKDILIT